ncbi:hypothetical protein LTR56_025566 [Elasticomyces elasticus]|nr:hypothetical protein LTR56_025566 [Elasticomyces elasticus]KAK3649900.1 hypothetical protein LTR22_012776 [Elasticomyces elasticus]KAK4918149.1 hypothetical protein LTR49_014005 [Elasticomyces elasticus]KAK5757695.1 hypothetical protein LTS12_012154 [Elasticomyces elasticus]
MASFRSDPVNEAQMQVSSSSTSNGEEKFLEPQIPHGRNPYRDTVVRKYPALVTHLPIYSWAWFLMPQTTLGLSNLLYTQHTTRSFDGLYTIGLTVYFVGFVQFWVLVILKTTQFILIKGTLRQSFVKPEEALFSAAFWISCYGVIVGALDFAEPSPGSRLSVALYSFFWIYSGFALGASAGIHMLLFDKENLEGDKMTPAWLLPILPVILIGVLAGSFSGEQDLGMYPALIAGLMAAGAGFFYTLLISAIYLAQLFTKGLPVPDTRPGMMLAVGPPCVAPLAFLKLAAGVPIGYGYFEEHALGAEIMQTIALTFAMPMFGLGCIFLTVAICAILQKARSMSFHLTWYGIVFPNVGVLSVLSLIAKQIPSDPLIWVFTAGTGILVAIWLFVTWCHLQAIWRHSEYLW